MAKESEKNLNKTKDKNKTELLLYLRCEVLWRATEGLHGSSVCDALFAEAKISDLDMAIFIQHQVLQLMDKKYV